MSRALQSGHDAGQAVLVCADVRVDPEDAEDRDDEQRVRARLVRQPAPGKAEEQGDDDTGGGERQATGGQEQAAAGGTAK